MPDKVFFVVMLLVVVVTANDNDTTTSTTSTTPSTTSTTTITTTVTTKTTTPSTTTTTTTTTPKTTTASPNSTTTQKTTSTATPPADKFINAFYEAWSCSSEKARTLDKNDITALIYRETLQILHNMTDKREFSACYTNLVAEPAYDQPKVMHLYSNNKHVCNDTNATQQILTTFDPTKPSSNYSMACLLNHQDKIEGTAFVAMGVCANINDNTEDPAVTSITCLEKLTPPEPSGGFATGTFFGGMILAIVLVAIGFVAYKYKCGRQGGFSQVFTVNANEFHDTDVDPHDPVLNLSTGRLDLITT